MASRRKRIIRLPAPYLRRIWLEPSRVADREAYPFCLPLSKRRSRNNHCFAVIRQTALALERKARDLSGLIRATEINIENSAVSARARMWMRQNNLDDNQLLQVFDVSDGNAVVIVSGISGKNVSEKAIKAYTLAGIASLLSSGEPAFNDKAGRDLCENLGCFDRPNHSRNLKDKGSNFLGGKDKGWKLTAPGLKFGATIIKELAGTAHA
jgi:hypothetical protein